MYQIIEHRLTRIIVIVFLSFLLLKVTHAQPLPDVLRDEGKIVNAVECEYKTQKFVCYLVTHEGEEFVVITKPMNGGFRPMFVLVLIAGDLIEVWNNPDTEA